MTRTEAVVRIQRGLGFRSDQESNIVLALLEAQRMLERGTSLPYFLLQEDEALTIASGSGEIALPARFLREKDNALPYFVDSSTARKAFLEKMDYDVGVKLFDAGDPGKPRAYSLRRGSLVVFPERDVSYSAIWSYYRGGVSLASDVENSWLEEEFGAPEALIGAAGISIASDLRNETAKKLFTEMFVVAWRGAFADGITRAEANRPLYVGGRL